MAGWLAGWRVYPEDHEIRRSCVLRTPGDDGVQRRLQHSGK